MHHMKAFYQLLVKSDTLHLSYFFQSKIDENVEIIYNGLRYIL